MPTSSLEHRFSEHAGQPAERIGRKRLLFLCQTLPFPPDGGVQIRSYNILRLLSYKYDVTALCFFRRATRPSPEAVEAGIAGLSGMAQVEAFQIPQEFSRLRLLWDHVRSATSRRPYTVFAYDSAEFAKRLKELLKFERFDLVHLDSLDLSSYLPALNGLPVACTHHNIESDLLARRALTEESPWKRYYFRIQASLLRSEEARWCPKIDLNAVVSDADGSRLTAIAPGANVITIPNGVDTKAFRPSPSTASARSIVFVGGYSWYPNRDALYYFGEEILPRIRRTTNVAVTWVGRAPTSVIDECSRKYGIRLTGYVEDIRPFVESAACYVVPLRIGGGTRLKILDAWAMGKAVVSTSVGCEGLQAVDRENILIRDDADAFASSVVELLEDVSLRERIGRAARQTAEEIYDWDVIGEKLHDAYDRLISPSRAVA